MRPIRSFILAAVAALHAPAVPGTKTFLVNDMPQNLNGLDLHAFGGGGTYRPAAPNRFARTNQRKARKLARQVNRHPANPRRAAA